MLLFKRRSEQDCGYLNYSSSVDELRFNKIPIQPSWMAFNVSSLRSGWARIERNSNPDWVFDEVLGSKTAPPSPDHKPAFRIEVYVNDFGQAIWSSNAVGCLTGLDETLAEIMPTQEENPGKWAKVLYAGSVPRKIGRGSTRIPKFTFVGWIDPISFTVGQFNQSAQTNDPVNLPF